MRDNIHSFDLVNCFWEFFKNQRMEKYTILVVVDILIVR